MMGLHEDLQKLNEYLDDGTYRAQFEYGGEELRLEILATADLLFEVADKVEEVLTDLLVRRKFDLTGNGQKDPDQTRTSRRDGGSF
ncbi:MAG: hypothetical protein AB1641_19220 [Thermodesulfobacteriota bacterium]